MSSAIERRQRNAINHIFLANITNLQGLAYHNLSKALHFLACPPPSNGLLMPLSVYDYAKLCQVFRNSGIAARPTRRSMMEQNSMKLFVASLRYKTVPVGLSEQLAVSPRRLPCTKWSEMKQSIRDSLGRITLAEVGSLSARQNWAVGLPPIASLPDRIRK